MNENPLLPFPARQPERQEKAVNSGQTFNTLQRRDLYGIHILPQL